MSRNGSGTYSLPAGNPVTTGTTISSTWANTTLSDIATALTQSIASDGQTTPTANLPMGGYKLTGLGSGTSASDAATYAQTYNQPAAASVTSAATTNIGAAASSSVTITGTTTITAFDAVADGIKRDVTFSGALTLTHNATSLILPGGANITTAAGDSATFLSLGSGNWRCIKYVVAASLPYVKTNILGTVSQSSGVPTGAIIERGSNANGEYVRFADGTQICTQAVNPGTVGLSASGASYISSSPQGGGALPATFAAGTTPAYYSSLRSDQGTAWLTGAAAATTTNFQQAYLMASTSSPLTSTVITMCVIGRWF